MGGKVLLFLFLPDDRRGGQVGGDLQRVPGRVTRLLITDRCGTAQQVQALRAEGLSSDMPDYVTTLTLWKIK